MVFAAITTELFLLVASCMVLIVGTISTQHKKEFVVTAVTFSMFMALILACYNSGFHAMELFNREYLHDSLASFLKIALIFFGTLVFLTVDKNLSSEHIVEYYVLAILSIIGMMVMVSSITFLSLFLGLELMALPIYTMVALDRDNKLATEAAIKYFLMGAVATAVMLYGISILYGLSGSINFLEIQDVVQNTLWSHNNKAFIFAMLLIMTGIGFKFAVFPYHAWAPDVYSGSSLTSVIFIATLPKLAAYALIFKILVITFPVLVDVWQTWLIVIGVLSIAFGNIVALVQTNIKRLLGYSAIANMGYVLLGFAATTIAGYVASIFYLVAYIIGSIAAFSVLISINNQIGITNIRDLQGLYQRSPLMSFGLLLAMFSFAGVPPLAGFLAKFFVLQSLFAVGFTKVVVIALILSVVGAFYYIRIVRVVYFESPSHTSKIVISRRVSALIGVISILLLLLGFFPDLLLEKLPELINI